MQLGSIRTKERRILIGLLAIVLLMTGIFAFLGYVTKRKYEEQAVMAEEYLKAGDYEQAVQAYLKALSMKNSNKELLTLGLAEAYIAMDNYDKALEVLRNQYMKKGSNTLKEKIEEVSAKKTDYEFNQVVAHAETYYSNGEYEKAINEYKKAKLIKSKEAISYQRIAQAYIALGNYNQARNEAMEGLALTQSEQLSAILSRVEHYLKDTQYTELLNTASEYIYQENYEDGILKLKEAIALFPREEAAYKSLAEVYIQLKDYESAVSLLEEILDKRESAALRELYNTAEGLRDEQKQREKLLKELYEAVRDADSDQILKLMENTFFTMKIAGSNPVYYSNNKEEKIENGNGMVILDQDHIYVGGFQNGLKNGVGVYFMRWQEKEKQGWSIYEGEWSNDYPNGMGKLTEEIAAKETDGKVHKLLTVSEGEFIIGLETDVHSKTFYRDGEERGSIKYHILSGIPQALTDANGKEIPAETKGSYVIAELLKNQQPTGTYYTVKEGTVWGFAPYIKQKK